MNKEKLLKKETKEPLFVTIGRIRGVARNMGNERLKLLIDKVSRDLVGMSIL